MISYDYEFIAYDFTMISYALSEIAQCDICMIDHIEFIPQFDEITWKSHVKSHAAVTRERSQRPHSYLHWLPYMYMQDTL